MENKFYIKAGSWKKRTILLLLAIITFSTVVTAGPKVEPLGAENVNLQINNKLITLEMKEVPIKDVFREIQRQSNISFVFPDDAQLNEIGKVSIRVTNKSVDQALDLLLIGTGLNYRIIGNGITIYKAPVKTSAPQILEGRVIDNEKRPVVGVAVMIKGTNTGVTTDKDGRFSIKAQKGQLIIFSFVGMKRVEVAYDGTNNLQIIMQEETASVGEVVVTGYQTINRKQLTSAVTSLKASDILIEGKTSIDQMLEGQIPDLMVTSNSGEVGVVPRLRLRGTSTLIGNREPLWVLDGVVMTDPVNVSTDELNDPDYINRIGNAIAGINPRDIERIDVLKDAAATALYGAKAANGVIVITTKQGRVGKPQVSYGLNATLKIRPRYTDRKIDIMNSQERINFSRDIITNTNYQFPSMASLVGYEGALAQYYNKQISYDQFSERVRYFETINTDWFDLLTEDALSTDHSLNVAGGSETIRYYASAGYSNNKDVIKNNKLDRYTFNSNLNIQMSRKLNLGLSISGNVSDKDYYQASIAPLDYAYNTSRAIPAYNEEGDYFYYGKKAYIDNKLSELKYNILNELDNSSYTQKMSSVNARANLRYAATDWLSATALFSYSSSNTEIEDTWNEKSYRVAQLRGSNYGESFNPAKTLLPYGGTLNKNFTRNNSWTARFQVDMNKYVDEERNHLINANLGFEAGSTKYDSYTSATRGYYADRGKQFTSGGQVGKYPMYDAWLIGNAPSISDNLTNIVSGYLSVAYSYKNLFTLNANTRYDGSNRFGDRSNEKMLPVWSVSGNYNFAEHLKPFTRIFDELSFKASYGYQGNMLADQSPVMIIKKLPMDANYNETVSEVKAYPNPNLRWEKTGSLNLGLDMALLNRRLMIGLSYYDKRTKDAYLNVHVSKINGVSQYVVNGANISNSGYSIALTAVPVSGGDWYWSMSTSWSKVQNKSESLPGYDQYTLSNFLNGSVIAEGHPIGTFFSYDFTGLDPKDGHPLFACDQIKPTDFNKLSRYETYTKALVSSGSREPFMSGGINTTVRYKNWRMNASFAYSLGAKTRLFKIYSPTRAFLPEQNVNKVFLNAWKKPGDELTTNIPAIMNSSTPYDYHWSYWTSQEGKTQPIADNCWDMYNHSDLRVVSTDHLKCSNLSLTYSMPNKWFAGYVSRADVTFSTTNLFTIASPELKGMTPSQGGFTEIQLSERPTFTLGINLTF